MLRFAGQRAGMWKGLAMGAVLATVSACRPRSTGYYVEVSADPNVRQAIQMVRVRVYAPPTDTLPVEERDFVLGVNQPFPLTFNVVSRTAGTNVRIDVDGFRWPTNNPGDGFVRARVVTNFVDGQTLFLPMRLFDACVDRVTACEDEFRANRCNTRGTCEIAEVDQSMLAKVDPDGNIEDTGTSLPMDSGMTDTGTTDTGTPDAGMDTGTDTGAADAGTDVVTPPG